MHEPNSKKVNRNLIHMHENYNRTKFELIEELTARKLKKSYRKPPSRHYAHTAYAGSSKLVGRNVINKITCLHLPQKRVSC